MTNCVSLETLQNALGERVERQVEQKKDEKRV